MLLFNSKALLSQQQKLCDAAVNFICVPKFTAASHGPLCVNVESCLNSQIVKQKSISKILIFRKKDIFIQYLFLCLSIKLHCGTCVILVLEFLMFFCILALVWCISYLPLCPFNISL